MTRITLSGWWWATILPHMRNYRPVLDPILAWEARDGNRMRMTTAYTLTLTEEAAADVELALAASGFTRDIACAETVAIP